MVELWAFRSCSVRRSKEFVSLIRKEVVNMAWWWHCTTVGVCRELVCLKMCGHFACCFHHCWWGIWNANTSYAQCLSTGMQQGAHINFKPTGEAKVEVGTEYYLLPHNCPQLPSNNFGKIKIAPTLMFCEGNQNFFNQNIFFWCLLALLTPLKLHVTKGYA